MCILFFECKHTKCVACVHYKKETCETKVNHYVPIMQLKLIVGTITHAIMIWKPTKTVWLKLGFQHAMHRTVLHHSGNDAVQATQKTEKLGL